MKTKCTFFIVAALLIFFTSIVHASHIGGGSISYRWINGNSYQVTITVYRTATVTIEGASPLSRFHFNLYDAIGRNVLKTEMQNKLLIDGSLFFFRNVFL